MLRLTSLFCFLLLGIYCYSQAPVKQNNNVDAVSLFITIQGKPVADLKYTRLIDGTPYFNQEWMRGSVVLKDGTEYMNLLLRLDLLDNSLEYQDKAGEQLVATVPIKEVRFGDSIMNTSVRFIHSSEIAATNVETGWYLLLATGKASLYKRLQKSLKEEKPYGSATVEQSISTTAQYFLLKDNNFSRIKKIKEMPDMLTDKRTLLSKSIADNKYSGKTDADYIVLVGQYNQ